MIHIPCMSSYVLDVWWQLDILVEQLYSSWDQVYFFSEMSRNKF